MKCSERIRGLREDHDYSQADIAKLLNVAQTTYSDYENDRLRTPLEALIVLAEHYDVSMNYICGVSNEKGRFPTR